LVKRSCQAVALVLTFPSAAVCGFGRWQAAYLTFAQGYALLPGAPGNFLRSSFYRMSLDHCSLDTTISFGSFFVCREASVGEYVSIGSFCVIERASIGAGTQIASHVEIVSGAARVTIGSRCWIGASSIIMADVGEGSTIGAGAVVDKLVPAGMLAVGNPSRVIQ
jgi:acetyltransferase-like isoleucine patch superfamily enzyme